MTRPKTRTSKGYKYCPIHKCRMEIEAYIPAQPHQRSTGPTRVCPVCRTIALESARKEQITSTLEAVITAESVGTKVKPHPNGGD